MLSAPIETIVKMVESLPETTQILIVEKIRDYIEEIQDEVHWNSQFRKTENKLIQAARKAKKEICPSTSSGNETSSRQ